MAFSAKEKPAKTLVKMEVPSIATKKMTVSDEISTPEKPILLPWRSRIAYSVKEVKEVALGLQKPQKDSYFRRSDLNGSGEGEDDDLLEVEEELKSSSCSSDLLCKSPKTKSPIKKLPDKYEILVEFFNSMESSIRLLRLKRSLPTFANICSSIQHLTGRRFTYGHLAQLKYVLPEAISIKKVLLRDEATCCMKPELQVYLQTDAIESGLKRKEESGYSILRKVFRRRLANFSREYPEADDVPAEELPHPFGRQTQPNIPSDVTRGSTCSMPINSTADTSQFTAMASHIPRTFQRWFSRKPLVPENVKTSLACLNRVTPKDDSPLPSVPSPIKSTSKPTMCKRPLFASPIPKPFSTSHSTLKDNRLTSVPSTIKSTSKPTMCKRPLFASPIPKPSSSSHSASMDNRLINAEKHSPKKLNHFDGTPAKLVSTPVRLMTATPEIQDPKRHCSTTCDTPVKEPEKQSARAKLLFATPQKSVEIKDTENVAMSISDDDDVINILPETLLQEIKEKERKAVEERGTGAAEAKRRKEMVASLPKFFDVILLIFQSGNRAKITKQELIHKIISGCFSIADRSEVEQQLKLLQELVPDWISSKLVSTGDFLYSVNKTSSPQEIRQRLAEAK